MPELKTKPPDFTPTGRYTQERMEAINQIHNTGFLTEEEQCLLHHFMMEHNGVFAWTDEEQGSFKTKYFPPIDILTIPHKPWIQKNILIPPGIYDQVCEIIWTKIKAGVYEPSNASYWLHWFCVAKKDGQLWLVHSLEPLNTVTIQHLGILPIPEHLA